MTFSELKKKDIICIGDGRLLGRTSDIEIDPCDGRIRALIVGGGGIFCFGHGDKNAVMIPLSQSACIGDDVILVSGGAGCGCEK